MPPRHAGEEPCRDEVSPYYPGESILGLPITSANIPGVAEVIASRVGIPTQVGNPLGMKCGPSLETDALLKLLDTLNPAREPGRITPGEPQPVPPQDVSTTPA